MRLIRLSTLLVSSMLIAHVAAVGAVFAVDVDTTSRHDYPERMLSRGEAIDKIVNTFDLKENYSSFITKCLANADDCFFVFAAMSDFEGISFNPLKLYPDVYPRYRYYDSINVASMLGLVHGYLEENKTPFKPEIVMSRIQALKVVMGAAELMKWKERFEIDTPEASLFDDIDENDANRWWYTRYANFALNAGIVPADDAFRPDEPIQLHEFEDLVNNTLDYKQKAKHDTQAVS